MGSKGSHLWAPLASDEDDAWKGSPRSVALKELEAQGAGGALPDPPRQWQMGRHPGSGQCEYQGYDTWTPEEQQRFQEGALREKWGCLQVSIRLPISGCATPIWILYGYLPFIIPIWWLVWVLVTTIALGKPRFFPAFGLSIAVGFAVVNELVTKQICKRVLPKSLTDRPPEAVCKHPGMPSGHVMNAYTIMFWTFIECLFASNRALHVEWMAIIILVMGPVPWARVYNRDHTWCQVTVSAVVSLLMGSLAYYIRITHFPHHQHPWDWYFIEEARYFPRFPAKGA